MKWRVFKITQDPIEITYGGLFGGEADLIRKFIPGMAHYFIDEQEVSKRKFVTQANIEKRRSDADNR